MCKKIECKTVGAGVCLPNRDCAVVGIVNKQPLLCKRDCFVWLLIFFLGNEIE